MDVTHAPAQRTPGVCYATTDEGWDLPVVDVTHPTFQERSDDEHIEATIAATMASFERFRELSDHQKRAMAAGSVLIRGMLAAAGTSMSGLMTYLYKLGPANMDPSWASDIDRSVAAGITPVSMRLRLRHMAELLADAALAVLARHGGPLHLVNVAGGTAIDSLNALILLHRQHPETLAGRTVAIHVLDADAVGPAWGARALAALVAPDGPLAGVAVTLRHVAYDWGDTRVLRRLLADLAASDPGLLVSSEGGLFEYPTDVQMVENLCALRDGTPEDTAIVGTVVRNADTLDPRLAPMEAMAGRPTIRFLGAERFNRLAREAGWELTKVRAEAIHEVVALRRLIEP